jgi:hypothetical protein
MRTDNTAKLNIATVASFRLKRPKDAIFVLQKGHISRFLWLQLTNFQNSTLETGNIKHKCSFPFGHETQNA